MCGVYACMWSSPCVSVRMCVCGGGGVVKAARPAGGRGLGESGATKMRAVLAP